MDYILYAIAALVLILAVWIVRGWWDSRKLTLLPRMVDAAMVLVAEINRLDAQQASPQATAQQSITKQTYEAKLTALRESVAKLA